MKKILTWIAAGFGLGFLPKAPGTWGTLLGYPLWLLLSLLPFQQSLPARFLYACIPMALAIPICSAAEKTSKKTDPGWVVLDEIVAIPFCLLLFQPQNQLVVLIPLSFLLFRVFDILKPPPVFQIQRLHGGLGVVLDDVLAGVYTCALLLFLQWVGVPGL